MFLSETLNHKSLQSTSEKAQSHDRCFYKLVSVAKGLPLPSAKSPGGKFTLGATVATFNSLGSKDS